MPMERPDSNVPKVESENSIEGQIAEQEAQLQENTKSFLGKAKDFKDFLFHGPEILKGEYPVEQSVDELIAEVNEKFSSRVKNWPPMLGMMFATFGAIGGNPGGVEGLQIGAERALEGATLAGIAVAALWGVGQLKARIQGRKENNK